ncbi:hypothetical protein A8C56_02460 [Niabella ginsenosidivorans]|uniref:Uncharacterized protein n=1 Tax=Niabella ginsenosidivorans TaxID=1176587 RepID=A0A1A9HX54_9BACT|nr:hypothetical protein A8C56_02460 [Niabella ginsenosidivorans]
MLRKVGCNNNKFSCRHPGRTCQPAEKPEALSIVKHPYYRNAFLSERAVRYGRGLRPASPEPSEQYDPGEATTLNIKNTTNRYGWLYTIIY